MVLHLLYTVCLSACCVFGAGKEKVIGQGFYPVPAALHYKTFYVSCHAKVYGCCRDRSNGCQAGKSIQLSLLSIMIRPHINKRIIITVKIDIKILSSQSIGRSLKKSMIPATPIMINGPMMKKIISLNTTFAMVISVPPPIAKKFHVSLMLTYSRFSFVTVAVISYLPCSSCSRIQASTVSGEKRILPRSR